MDNDEQTDALVLQRRRYQWYTGYDRDDEYDKEPQWSLDMAARTEEREEEPDRTFFHDRYDPEHMWLSATTTYDLTNCL